MTMSVVVTDELDSLKQEMHEKVKQLDRKQGLLTLTDIVGGMPTNLIEKTSFFLLSNKNF